MNPLTEATCLNCREPLHAFQNDDGLIAGFACVWCGLIFRAFIPISREWIRRRPHVHCLVGHFR